MQLSLVQRIELFFLRQLINGIWFIDLVTGYPLNSAVRFSARPVVTACLVMVVFLGMLVTRDSPYRTYLKEKSENSSTKGTYIVADTGEVLGKTAVSAIVPVLVSEKEFPEVSARSILVADKKTDTHLYSRDSRKILASASTTKLMTALTALSVYSPDDQVTVSRECTEVESTRVGFPEGTVFKSADLITAMLVSSAGDAACVLGSSKIDANEFLYLMNESALNLGMTGTFFTNPIGLDGINGSQFSTAEDLYILAKVAMEKSFIRDAVGKTSYDLVSENGGYRIALKNTNRLLSEIPNSVGIKTGTTEEAGEVLIYEYDDGNNDIVIIVMGSRDRFSDTRAILDWVLSSYSWQ